MPNIKSAKKRVKIASTKTLRNKTINSDVKTWVKKFEAALTDGNLDNARALYSQIIKKIDMATSKGVYHKNAADRKKSNLAVKLHKAQAQ